MRHFKFSTSAPPLTSSVYDGAVNKTDFDRLASVPCSSEVVGRAALFSLLTGIRYSVIQELCWQDVVIDCEDTIIRHRHPNYGLIIVKLSDQALSYCDHRYHPYDLLFDGLPDESWLSVILAKWAKDAGIKHRLTFFGFGVSKSSRPHSKHHHYV